jgi:hypothetical protein
MLLEAPALEQVSRHGSVKTQAIEMGDPGTMMSYMFDTIYTNKIKVIVQELACNARDAHREIGNPDEPITIKLPTEFDPAFFIQDHGVGLSPTRINEIYRKIGNSTKRGSNSQTGGFGIGSKTPWAKVNLFLVKTTSMEGDDLVYREYTMIRSGVHFTVNEMTDPEIRDPAMFRTGTTVEMEFEKSDWNQITKEIQKLFIEWPVKPNIIGTGFTWEYETNIILTGKNYKVIGQKYDNRTYVCMDYIPYTLSESDLVNMLPKLITNIQLDENTILNELEDAETQKKLARIKDLCSIFFRINCVLYFKTGELSPALNRESLQYDEKTCRAIISKICSTVSLIMANYKSEVEKKDTFVEALRYWKVLHTDVLRNTHSNFSHVMWNGIRLNSQMAMQLPQGVNAKIYKLRQKGNTLLKLDVDTSDSIVITDDITDRLFIYDSKINERNLKYYMEQKGLFFTFSLESKVIICLRFSDKITYDSTTQTTITIPAADVEKEFFNSLMWKGMSHQGSIANLPKRPFVRLARGSTGGPKKVPFTINKWIGHKFDTTDVLITDSFEDVVYVITEHRQSDYSDETLNSCSVLLECDIYGISKRMADRIPANWVSLDDAMKELLEEKDHEELYTEIVQSKTKIHEILLAKDIFPSEIHKVFNSIDCNAKIANVKWCRLKELYNTHFNMCNEYIFKDITPKKDIGSLQSTYWKLQQLSLKFLNAPLQDLPTEDSFDDVTTSPQIEEAKELLDGFKLIVLALSSYRNSYGKNFHDYVDEICDYINFKA